MSDQENKEARAPTDSAEEPLTGNVRPREEEQDIGTTEETPSERQTSKRARVSDSHENAAVVAASAAAPAECIAVLSSDNCAICLEGAAEEKELMEHNCPQCTKGAWRICEPCNDAILSRRCPVCHGDYKPIEFYSFANPDSVDDELAGLAVAAFSRCKVSVMATSNVMIWSPSSNKLSFSLPVDVSVPKRDIQYLRSTIVPSAEDVARLREGVFSFTNKIWDSLEAAEDSTEQTGVREMLAWILGTLANPDAILFTPLTKDQQLELLRETLRCSLGESS